MVRTEMNIQSLEIAIISPSILAVLTAVIQNHFRKKEKKLDWEREDKKDRERIDRANVVAQSLLSSNEQIAITAAESHRETNQKLEVIRVDVNSNMTQAMKNELDATEGQLTLLLEMVELKKERGTQPTKEALTYIAAKRVKINELKATLNDRLTHSKAAAAAAATEEEEVPSVT